PEALPVRGLPDHEHPVDLRLLQHLLLAVRGEPEAVTGAVMDDDSLDLRVHPGEIDENGVERLGIAAALSVPLAAAERWAFPPGDPARVVEDHGRPGRPARIGDRLVAFPARDQRGCLPWGGRRQHGDQETRRDSAHGIPRSAWRATQGIYGRKAGFLATKSEPGDISRVRRVGCWSDDGWPCPSAVRLRFEAEGRNGHIGFGVVTVRP